jgi:hypothetical protein
MEVSALQIEVMEKMWNAALGEVVNLPTRLILDHLEMLLMLRLEKVTMIAFATMRAIKVASGNHSRFDVLPFLIDPRPYGK